MSPLWRPTPKMDRLLVESKEIQQKLMSAVKELDRFVDLLNERTEQIQHDQEAGESE